MSNPFADSNPFEEQNPFSSGGGYGTSSASYAPPQASTQASAAAPSSSNAFDITSGATGSSDAVGRKKHAAPSRVVVEPAVAAAPAPAPATAPAVGSSAFNDPPPIASGANAFASPQDAALRAKEEELRKREAALHKTTASHIKNWPICYPVAKHYPSTEIPANHKWTVRLAYWTYLMSVVTLFWNFLVMAALWGKGVSSITSTAFVVALAYWVCGSVAGWWWYKSLYIATRDDLTRKYICFFVEVMIHTAFFILGSVGLPATFQSGVILTATAATHHYGSGITIMALVGCILWILTTLSTLLVLRKAHSDYRTKGIEGFYAMRGDATKAVGGAAADAAWSQARSNHR